MKIIAAFVLACLLLATQCFSSCVDIDTVACQTMSLQNKNLCNDPTLSNVACPKYCKRCPITCYHCDSSVRSYKDCNTTRICQAGERCLLLQLLSSKDGHREYRMSCANVDTCDGNGVMLLGRRDVNTRNLITECCSNDLCNYPDYRQTTTSSTQKAATTTSKPTTSVTPTHANTTHRHVCQRDIEVLIEESRATSAHHIVGFLKDLVSQIKIGPHHNQLGVAFYNDDVTELFELHSYAYKPELLQAIDRIHFIVPENAVDKGDVMDFLQHHLRQGHDGDRPNFHNVVIIIEDQFPHQYQSGQSADLLSASKDIIVINVGANGRTSLLSSLASSPNHVIDVPDYYALATTLPKVLNLLCL